MKRWYTKVNHEYLNDILIPSYVKSLQQLLVELPDEWDIDEWDEETKGKVVGIYEGVETLHNQHWLIRESLEYV